jgi:hypothetical protein
MDLLTRQSDEDTALRIAIQSLDHSGTSVEGDGRRPVDEAHDAPMAARNLLTARTAAGSIPPWDMPAWQDAGAEPASGGAIPAT